MKHKKAFTLIELLVVIAILAGFVSMLIPNFMNARSKSRDTRRKSDLKQLQKALELYRQNHAPQVFPTAIPDPPSGFTDSSDASSTLYMNNIPADPITTQRYYYKSPDPSRNSGTDPTTYEIYACLEDKTDSEKTVCPGNFKDVTGAVCATSFCYKLIEP